MLCSLLLFTQALASASVGLPQTEFLIAARPGTRLEDLQRLTSGWARIESKLKGENRYRIRVTSSLSAAQAETYLRSSRKIEVLDSYPVFNPEAVDPNSVSSLKREIDRLKRAGVDDERLDYYEAREWYLSKRAYPYDRIDGSAYYRAAEQRKYDAPASRLAGSQWEYVGPRNLKSPGTIYFGPSPIGGRMNAVAYSPTNPNTIFAGGAAGHFWRSDDGGQNWTVKGSNWEFPYVNCIAAVDSNTIYVGIGDFQGVRGFGRGIQKTTDGGNTWTKLSSGLPTNLGVTQIVIDPDNSTHLVVTTGGPTAYFGGIFRSTDSGASWTRVDNQASQNIWNSLSVGLANGGTRRWYAAAGGFTPTRLYTSVDDGITWTPLTVPGLTQSNTVKWIYSVAASKVDADTVYFLAPFENKIYKSTDGGKNWTDITTGFPSGNGGVGALYNWSQYYYDAYIAVSTAVVNSVTKDAIYVGLIDLDVSVDGGATWKSIGASYTGNAQIHNDQHAWAANPTNPNEILIGNDGGVYKAVLTPANSTAVFSTLNAQMGTLMFYDLAAHPTVANILIGGTQDNSTPYAANDINNWVSKVTGDGGFAAINQVNTAQMFGTAQNLTVMRTDNSWQTSTDMSPNTGADAVGFIAPIALNAGNQNQLLAGTNYLYTWTAAGGWKNRVGGQQLASGGKSITAIASGLDGQRIVTGSDDGQIWLSKDDGATWTQITAPPFPDRSISSISISDSTPNDILVGVSGTGSGHLWRCQDTDSGTPVWVDVSGTGLPNIPLNTIARDLDAPNTAWWVGTDIGVYYTTDSGATWKDGTLPLGLPICEVSKLVAVPGTRYLNAGTYGRGAWRLLIPASNIQISNLTLNPTTVVGGTNIQGTVTLSSAPPTNVVVTLASSTGGITVPASVIVSAGATTGTFAVTTSPVGVVTTGTITASTSASSKGAPLTVNPPSLQKIDFAPGSTAGGNTVTGTLTLTGPAPLGGVTATLGSDTAAATPAASVVVAAGAKTGTFAVTTSTVGVSTTVTVTATSTFGSTTGSFTLTPPAVSTVSVNPNSVGGTLVSVGTVTLFGPAPVGGVAVSLTSGNTAVAQVPISVIVLAGATTATFTVTTLAVATDTTVQISATSGSGTASTTLTVKAPQLSGISFNPTSVLGGLTTAGTISLAGPAPAAGLPVALSITGAGLSSNTTVTVPGGAVGVNFTLQTKAVAADAVATITATAGTVTKTTTINVLTPSPQSVTFTPNPVGIGQACTGTVILNGPAGSAGKIVSLTSTSTLVTVPATVTVKAGATTATFVVTTTKVTSDLVATIKAGAASGDLTVKAPKLTGLTLTLSTLPGGSTTTGKVTLSQAAPTAGFTVALSSSAAGAKVPATVKVLSGATFATFAVTTVAVAADTVATISASGNGATFTAPLTVQAPHVLSVTMLPTKVLGGKTSVGTIKLSGAPPTGGVTASLASDSAAVTLPATVKISAVSGTFTATSHSVLADTTVNLSATLNGVNVSAPLLVTAPLVTAMKVTTVTVKGGSNLTGSVTIGSAAPAGGLGVVLSSTVSAVDGATVTVPAGATTVNFALTTHPVLADTPVTLTATRGTSKVTGTSKVLAPVAKFAVSPLTIKGGNSVTGTLTLDGPAPAGFVFTVTVVSPLSAPASVTFVAGEKTAVFTISSSSVTKSTACTVTVKKGAVTLTGKVTVTP